MMETRSILLCICVSITVCLLTNSSLAQTKGLIYKPAVGGQSVLDPNLDGYTSSNSSGFSMDDETESEIPFTPLPSVGTAEPDSDLGPGPSCGFTDLVKSDDNHTIYTYLDDDNNLMFRFRLGGTASNSKGYSILIDTDQKFGSSGSNADPNYVVGNPGFEIEIVLETNFGVGLYDVDGSTSPSEIGDAATDRPYNDYSQKSIAISEICGDDDYFYDFYIPFADITAAFPGVTISTPMRMVGNTVINPSASIGNNGISDLGGIDDQLGITDDLWGDLIDVFPPTSPDDIGSGATLPPRADCPSIDAPIAIGATSISGTSTELDGTFIEVFKDGLSIGTTVLSSGVWTLSGITALAASEVITATATVPESAGSAKSTSYSDCNPVTVAATCSPTISSGTSFTISTKGLCGDAGSAIAGAEIKVYFEGVLLTPNTGSSNWASGKVYANGDGSWIWKCNTNSGCTAGGGCSFATSGFYEITQTEGGSCESDPFEYCAGGAATSSAPVITPLPTTSSTSLDGTATADASITWFLNDVEQATTTATGGLWSFAVAGLIEGDSIKVRSIESGNCSAETTVAVGGQSGTPIITTPVISGAYCTGTTITSVSGISSEIGATITLYTKGSAGVTTSDTNSGSTLVTGSGDWTITGLSLSAGTFMAATATNTGELESELSNELEILSQTGDGSLAITTPSINEGDASISGTGTIGNTIFLYIDGFIIDGFSTTADGSGNWTISGLDEASAGYDVLFAGGTVGVTSKSGSLCESDIVTGPTIACKLPISQSFSATTATTVCTGETITFDIDATENLIVYQLVDQSNNTLGTAMLGDGSALTLIADGLTSSVTTISVKASKIGITCENTFGSVAVTVEAISTSHTSSNPTDCLSPDGSITLSGLNNTQSYDVNYWVDGILVNTTLSSDGSGDLVIPNLGPGDYTDISVSGLATTLVCASNTIAGPISLVNASSPTLTLGAGTDPTTCGGTEGSISLTSSIASVVSYDVDYLDNGVSQSTTISSDVSGNIVIPSLDAGTYSNISITNTSNGCKSNTVGPVTLNDPDPTISLGGTSNPITCGGNGTINLSFTDIPDGTYSINYDGGSFSSVNVSSNAASIAAAAGVYSNLRITEPVTGCTTDEDPDVVLSDPTNHTISATRTNPSTCGGNGSINLTFTNVPDGTYTIDYEDVSASPQTFTNVSVSSNAAIINAPAGTYNNLSLTLSGCISTGFPDILLEDPTPPALPTVTASVTNDPTPVIAGTAEAGNTLTVVVAGATYSTIADGSGNWSIDTGSDTPDSGTFSPDVNGTNEVAVTADDGSCTSNDATSNELTIDTTPPATPTVTAQVTNDPTPVIAGTAEIGSTVTVVVAGATYSTTADGSGNWSIDTGSDTPDSGTFSPNVNGTNEVAVTSTDAAGNSTSDATSNELTIDTTPPATPTVAAQVTNDPTPVIAGTAEIGSTVTVVVAGATYSTTADGSGNWSIDTGSDTPDSGTFSPDVNGTNEVAVTSTDAAGNSTSDATSNELTIDTTPPATPTVAAQVTNDPTPVIAGTAEIGSTVTVVVAGATYSTTADGSGNWSIDTGSDTPDSGTFSPDVNGTNEVAVTSTDAAGNSTSDATSNELTIDTTPPATPTVTAQVTNDPTPVIAGTAEIGSTVTVVVAGATYSTTADGSGNWSIDTGSDTPDSGTFSPDVNGTNEVAVTSTDAAGNSTSDATSNELTIDTTPPATPTVTAQVTNDPTPVIAGTAEIGSTVTVVVAGATYSTTADGSGNWSIDTGSDTPDSGTFSPDVNGTNEVAVTSTDAAGNSTSDATSNELTIDTTPPATPTVTAQVTNDPTPVIAGTAEIGSTVTVVVAGATYSTTADGSGNWSIDTGSDTPDSGTFSPNVNGTNEVAVTSTDAAGNSTSDATSNELTIDTTPPATPTVAAQVTNDPTPVIAGTAEIGSTVTVVVAGATYSTTADGSGNWSIDTGSDTPDSGTFSPDVNGTNEVAVTSTDAAGNSTSDATSNELTIDTTPPATPTVTAQVTNDPTPVIAGTAEIGSTVTVVVAGATYSTTADGSGNWSIDTGSDTPDSGTFSPNVNGTNEVAVTSTDAAGNSTSDATSNELTIDTTPPATPTVAAQVTNDPTPVIAGTAEIGSTVTVAVAGATYSTTADGSGNWSIDTGSDTPDSGTFSPNVNGTNEVAVTSTDAAGNSTSDATSNELTIDTTPPATPTVTAQVTNDPTPVIAGTAEIGSTVTVVVAGATYSTTADGSGNWSIDTGSDTPDSGTFSPDVNGTNEVAVTSTDAAGNNTSDATSNELTIDTTPPMVPTIDIVSSNDTTPVISGTAEANSTVTVVIDGVTFETTADGSGDWTVNTETDSPTLGGPFNPLGEGVYDILITSTDDSGNSTSDTTTDELTIDTTPPMVPTIDIVSSNDTTPVISGTAEANSTVTVVIDGVTFETTADGSGDWTVNTETDSPTAGGPFDPLGEGVYDILITSTDDSGNSTSDTTTDELTIDTTPPMVPNIDIVSSNDTTPVISGTAEANSTVTVVIDGVTFETTADGSGDWTVNTETDSPTVGGPFNPLGEGVYDILITSTDDSGNSTSDTTTDELTIDTTPPMVPTIDIVSSNDTTPVISGTAEANSTVTVVIDGVTFETTADGSGDWTVNTETDSPTAGGPFDPLGEGVYDILITSTDDSGNSTSDTTTDELTIDTSIPSGDTDNDGIVDTNEDINGDSILENDDTDADGIPDYLDTDDDDDGILTSDEIANGDCDSDGILNYLDTDPCDIDGDGLNDNEDSNLDGNPYNDDCDEDGIPNFLDPDPCDTDGDGISDNAEDLNLDGDPTNDDTDADGIPDYLDTDDDDDGILTSDEIANGDCDSDGILNYLDTDPCDIDGDGLNDNEDSNLDGNPYNDDCDEDGIPNFLDPDPCDTDGDGISDNAEDLNLDGDPTNDDTDADGIPDYLDTDDDDDGILTSDEIANGDCDSDGILNYLDTDPCDIDGDGLNDNEDSNLDGNPYNDDCDEDGIPNFLDPDPCDTDGDGISDNAEDLNLDGDPTNDDTDADGIPDYLDTDDDDDGILTSDEIANGDCDSDGILNYLDADPCDTDGDGLNDEEEDINGDGNPYNDDCDEDNIPNFLDMDTCDTDGDGVYDSDEDTNGDGDLSNDDCDEDGTPNYLDTDPCDTDGDGLNDQQEDTNSDGNPYNDNCDGDGNPNFLDADTCDTDGDGIYDSDEDIDGDGDPSNDDCDEDGTPNYLDTDPCDTDGDGLNDQQEDANGDGNPYNDNCDGDGNPNFLDADTCDTDGDGIYDSDEDINGDGDPSNDDCDEDGTPNYLDTDPCDTDGDGLNDQQEDTNSDGNPYNDNCDGDGNPNFLDADTCDTDGDGIYDSDEDIDGDGDPSNDDCDEDGTPNYLDTDPCDTDGDGLNDQQEDTNGDGNPYNDNCDGDGNPNFLDANTCDTDGDGIYDSDEDIDGDGDPSNDDCDEDGTPNYLDTDPCDTDGDGLNDQQEDTNGDGNPYNDNCDGDGNPNFLDANTCDTDGDGIYDSDEDIDGDGDLSNDDCDRDGTPNYLDTDPCDTDGDGLDDQQEDADGDGNPYNDDCDEDLSPDFQDADQCIAIIPTKGFTPDGDGRNDYFHIEGIEDFPNNTVQIYNRWGNLIYETKGYNNADKAWRSESQFGLITGEKVVPEGTYFYLIDLKNGQRPLSGYVVVNR